MSPKKSCFGSKILFSPYFDTNLLKSKMKISIGSDHAGFEMKEKIISFLKQINKNVIDKGCYSAARADYPDFGHTVAN